MCDSPITIKNLNHISDLKIRERLKLKSPWKNFEDTHIQVPCGHCASCIRQKQDSIVQRVQFESQKNHLFMCTLTYAPEVLPHFGTSTGYSIRYADTHDVQNTMKMLRKDNAFGIPFRYLAVSELGSKCGRPHFHILFLFPKKHFYEQKDDYIAQCEGFASKSQHYFTVLNYWRRNYGSRRVPKWKPLTHYVEKFVNGQLRKNYDFHYVNPFLTENGVEDCGMYVLKYMFKPSSRAVRLQQALALNLDEAEYSYVWNVVRPRYFASVGFGLNAEVQLKQKKFDWDQDIVDQLKKDISVSRDNLDFPAHFHPFTGRQQLISPYYLKYAGIYSAYDRFHFWIKSGKSAPGVPDNIPTHKIKTITDYERDQKRLTKTSDHTDSLGVDVDLDLLDD